MPSHRTKHRFLAITLVLGGSLCSIYLHAQTVISSVLAGTKPNALVVNPVTNKIYAGDADSSTVTVIDGAMANYVFNAGITNSAVTVNAGAGQKALAVNPLTNKIYVASWGSWGLTVIDGATNSTSTVGVGVAPSAVAVNPLTNKVYVANYGSNAVTVIDGTTNVVSGTVNVGSFPYAVSVNTVTNKIYVVNNACGSPSYWGPGSVTVIDGTTNSTTTVPVGVNPVALAINPVTNKIYIANANTGSNGNNITVIDGTTNLTTTLNVGSGALSVAVNPVTNKIYAASYDDTNCGLCGHVTVIDGATNSTFDIDTGYEDISLAVNAVTNKVYVATTQKNVVMVIDGATNVESTINGASAGFLAINPVTNTIYVADSYDVTVIEGSTDPTTTVGAGITPSAIAVNAATNKTYVANLASNNVTVIDGSTNSTTTATAGTGPGALAVNPITNKVYVANSGSNDITVIDDVTTVAKLAAGGFDPVALAVNPVTNKIYVADFSSNIVEVIDGASNSPNWIGTGTNPVALDINPVTNKIYVANYVSNNVTVIDGATNSTTTVSVGAFPYAVSVNSVTNKIYVANYSSGSVTVIDGATNATSTIMTGAGPRSVAVNPITNKIYVATSGANSITVIDGATNRVTTISDSMDACCIQGVLVSTPYIPYALAVNPVSNKIYVANYPNNEVVYPQNTVLIIDGASGTTNTVSVGTNPVALAVNPVTNSIFVADEYSNNVTVINEQNVNAVFLQAEVVSFAGNVSGSLTPQFNFVAHSTFSPVTPQPDNLHFQLDTWEGPWTSAVAQGNGAFAGTTGSLQPGVHIMYAYVTDGQEATSTLGGNQSSPLISNIAAYLFLASGSAALSPVSLSFGNQVVGTASAAQTVTLSNSSGQPLNITGITVSFNYTMLTNCPGMLPPSQSCTIQVSFLPSVAGTANGTLTVKDNNLGIAGSTQTVTLTGTGVQGTLLGPTLSPTALNFGNQPVGSQSATQAVTLTNKASQSLSIAAILGGNGFLQNNNCGSSLAAGASCTINVLFAPSGVGPALGTISVTDDAANSPQVVQLSGTGVTPGTSLSTTVNTGPQPVAVAVNSVTNKVYVANFASANLTVVDGATNLTTTVSVGPQPVAVAVNPVTNKIYVANVNGNDVTVIDGVTNTAATVGAGINPYAVAVNPLTNKIYVANSGGDTVTVIDGVTNSATTVATWGSPIAIVVNPATNKIYVANSGSNNVTVIDGPTNSTVTVTAGTSPSAIAVNPVTNKIYVANVGSNSVTVIDGATNSITTISVGPRPVAVAANPVTNKIYVSSAASYNVTVIDGASNATSTVSTGNYSGALALDPGTAKLYVANYYGNSITVIDGATNTSATVSAGSQPYALAVNPVTNKVYTANTGSNNVTVIDGATNSTSSVTSGIWPVAVAINPASNKIYVANQALNNVSVIDGVTNATTAVAVGNHPSALSANFITSKVYVANTGSNNVTVIDGTTNSTATVNVGVGPLALAVNPVTNKVYVVNTNSVTVIDGATNATTTISAGIHPNPSETQAVAVNPVTNKIYVANASSNTVTVIDGATNTTATVSVGSPYALVVNPVTNKIYVVNNGYNSVTVIDGATNVTSAISEAGSGPLAINPVTNKIYLAAGIVTVIDGTTNIATQVNSFGTGASAVAVNPTTNKIYVSNFNSDNVMVIDGSSNATTVVPAGNSPAAVAVNPVTNQIYVPNYNDGTVTVINEQQVQPIPLQVAITPLAGNVSGLTPEFNFTAKSNFAPFAAPPDNLLFQVDTWQGSWSPAIAQGNGGFSGATATLQPGVHVLYAFATDGQEATSTMSGLESSPLIGNITGYVFLVSPASVSLSTDLLNFGNQAVGATSTAQLLTLSNNSSRPLTVASIATSKDYSTSNNCPSTLGSGQSCTINVSFVPTTAGADNGTLTVTDNSLGVNGSTQTAILKGTGALPVATMSLAGLSFGSQAVHTASAAQSLVLTNTGGLNLTIAGITASADYTATNGCPAILPPGQNCTITVSFTPTIFGVDNGTLTVTDNNLGVYGSTQTLILSGKGVVPATATMSPVSLNFGNQVIVGAKSAAQSLTLTNSGGASLSMGPIQATTNFVESNNCPPLLPAGASCTINVEFVPLSVGMLTGQISVTDNAANSPQLVQVSGTGVTAPAGNITSFSDSSGDRVLYVANDRPYGGDVHQFWLNGTQPVDTDATSEYSFMGSEWALFGTLTSFSDANGQHTFYIGGNDSHIHQLYWSWSTSSGSDLDWTALAGTLPTVGSSLTGFSNARGQHVFYTAWDSSTQRSHVHHLYGSGLGKPIDEDLIVKARPGSACASPNSMLTSFGDGTTELVYYVGPSGHLCELAWYLGAEGSYDLTSMSAGTLAMAGSPLSGFSDANGQIEFYLGTNQHVYQLRLTRTGVWSNPDLTAQLGGNPAVPDSLTSLSNANGEQVYYADSNQHVNQINVTTGAHVDLTALYGGGGASAMPLDQGLCQFGTSLASISKDAGGGEDVYYIGTDQHVYQFRFYLPSGNVWYNTDQTASHGGTLAGEQGSPLGWCVMQ